jgi:hypothetical protein
MLQTASRVLPLPDHPVVQIIPDIGAGDPAPVHGPGPSTSGLNDGFPPGLSVMDTAEIRPSANPSLAIPLSVSVFRHLDSRPETSSRVTTKFLGFNNSSPKILSMSISSEIKKPVEVALNRL